MRPEEGRNMSKSLKDRWDEAGGLKGVTKKARDNAGSLCNAGAIVAALYGVGRVILTGHVDSSTIAAAAAAAGLGYAGTKFQGPQLQGADKMHLQDVAMARGVKPSELSAFEQAHTAAFMFLAENCRDKDGNLLSARPEWQSAAKSNDTSEIKALLIKTGNGDLWREFADGAVLVNRAHGIMGNNKRYDVELRQPINKDKGGKIEEPADGPEIETAEGAEQNAGPRLHADGSVSTR